MTLYGYEGEMAKKFNRIEEAAKNETCAEMLLESLDINMGDITLGDFFLKMFSYVLGIPEEYWSKPFSELTKEDVEVLEKAFGSKDIRSFTEVM